MIYIQSENNLPHHFECSCVLHEAINNKLDYCLISYKDMCLLDNHIFLSNLFVGTVEFMREVFRKKGKFDVRLPKNSNRDYSIMSLKEAFFIAKNKKIFIKPFEIKLFTGLVLDGSIYTCLENIDRNIKVLVYEPFISQLESEWRIYVNNHTIMDSRNYSGDFMISPDYEYVKSIINENKSTFPIAYTIDIGILENKENVVVEFNDFWAIGNYGVPNYFYLKALKNRYFSI